MSYAHLLIEKRENGVAVVTLNNPETLNALSAEISRELCAALKEAEADPAVRVIVIRGAGRAFSSGGNLRDMQKSLSADPGQHMDDLTREVYGAIDAVSALSKPVIASVHGFAYGAAFNLVMACDLAIAAADTVFCESFIKIGLIPGGHATLLLPRIVGLRRALELCLTGRDVFAEEALIMGLVNLIVPASDLEAETMKLADRLAQAAPLAVAETKKLLKSYFEKSPSDQAALERQTQIRMARTLDFREGVNSFFEKRRPKFGGR